VQYVERWTTYDHQNVARCYGYALGHGPMPALIMKYHVKGNIIRYLKENQGSFDDKTRLVIIQCRPHVTRLLIVHHG